jgi:four helix bundle protein
MDQGTKGPRDQWTKGPRDQGTKGPEACLMLVYASMAKRLEELTVYQKAVEFWEAVTALLDRPAFRRDRKLRDQISDANDSITSNISEGFEQSSDRAFARYLFIAKGSLAEVCTRLRQACLKRYITPDELAQCLAVAETLAKMMASLIRYLARSDFKDRGRFKLGLPNPDIGTEAPGTRGPGTKGPGTKGPGTKGPGTKGPGTKGPGTKGPETKGPGTKGPGD